MRVRNKNEVCYVIWGVKIKRLKIGFLRKRTIGTPVLVSPDIEFMVKNIKYVLGTYHTHPMSFNAVPSELDRTSWKTEEPLYKNHPVYIIQTKHDPVLISKKHHKHWRLIWKIFIAWI